MLLGTKYMRIVGSRLVRTYVTTVPGGIKLRVRTGGKSDDGGGSSREEFTTEFAIVLGNVVVDVGDNIGAFSIKAAKVVGKTGQVLALEPESTNFALLIRNIQLNNARLLVTYRPSCPQPSRFARRNGEDRYEVAVMIGSDE